MISTLSIARKSKRFEGFLFVPDHPLRQITPQLICPMMTLSRYLLPLLVCVGLLCGLASAVRAEPSPDTTLRLGTLFTNGVVLQRELPLPVWGWATPGAEVTVTFKLKSLTAKAESDGRWQVVFPPLPADATGTLLTVTSGGQTLGVSDVLVGEVWICGGRSNMALVGGKIPDAGEVLAGRTAPLLRLCAIPASIKGAPDPLEDLLSPAVWQRADPSVLSSFSAVAGLFGHELQSALGVPVGIIANNWGGSTAPLWIRYEAYQVFKKNHGPASPPSMDAELEQRSAEYHRQTGDYADERRPGNLYNTRFAPLIPFSIRGIVWYLDDATGPITEATILDWRRQWKLARLNILLVQNHPAGAPGTDPNASDLLKGALGGPKARQEFMELTHRLPDCWSVVTTDTGDNANPKEIHPANKLPIARRLALVARETIYGQAVLGRSPELQKVLAYGSQVSVVFAHVGTGLRTREGGPVRGFALSEDGRQWTWADATIPKPDTVVLQATGVTKPKFVRFAYAAFPVFDLYNSARLPASPFEARVD